MSGHEDATRDRADARQPVRPRSEHRHDTEPARGAPLLVDLQLSVGNRAVVSMLENRGLISRDGDEHERHADSAADTGGVGATEQAPAISTAAADTDRMALESELGRIGSGLPLPENVRDSLEPRFGASFSDVRVHTGEAAGRANDALGADAFTYGKDIYYASGRKPAADPLTAHELGHVTQHRSAGDGAKRILPSRAGSFPVTNGIFEIDWQTRQAKSDTTTTHVGLDGYMRFLPKAGAPNSNTIVFTQIAKLTDRGGTDVHPSVLGGPQANRGALGTQGVMTADDPLRGVKGGFFTDASHQSGGLPAAAGSNLAPDYDVSAAAPGTTGTVGKTPQLALRGGGVGGRFQLDPGFKRSDDDADMDSATMYDIPGTTDTAANLIFEFESVVRGVDTEITYGVFKWGFEIVDGVVTNEHYGALDTASATFGEAMNRHMDFYVHEPMTFYFDFDKAIVNPSEQAKIDHLLPYLARNPKATMSLVGEADIKGGRSGYNADLALRRADAVKAAMIASGVTEDHLDPITIGAGASTAATTNAGTGDMGGDPAVGADQDREANRWANRRVTVTFTNPKGP